MKKRDIFVIGGSAGALKALMALFANMHDDLTATVFIVLHTSADSPCLLADILSSKSRVRVQYAEDHQRFEKGMVYIAPPDRHMLVDADGVIHLTRGPKENRFRPAIDPLFRSAALNFGPRVAGVLLSGGLDDGVTGLAAIKVAGGVAIVQDPDEADVPSIPQNALKHVDVDWVLPAASMAALLVSLPRGESEPARTHHGLSVMKKKTLEIEVGLAEEKEGLRNGVLELGSPSIFTCPECHGTLLELTDESLRRFRCHTGHAYTVNSLFSILSERVEETLWNSVRAIEESALLLNHMASHVDESDEATRRQFREAVEAALDRAKAVRAIITQGQPSPLERQRAAE